MRIALVCLALAGCASQPPNYVTPQEAQTMSAAELCLGLSVWGPISANAAAQELNRRSVNCQDHAQAIQALQAQRAQALGILLSRPPVTYTPYQIPAPPTQQRTVCTTERIGNQLQTVCR